MTSSSRDSRSTRRDGMLLCKTGDNVSRFLRFRFRASMSWNCESEENPLHLYTLPLGEDRHGRHRGVSQCVMQRVPAEDPECERWGSLSFPLLRDASPRSSASRSLSAASRRPFQSLVHEAVYKLRKYSLGLLAMSESISS
jgi:hypothetical protein